jgi:dipeptidase E
MSWIFVTYSLLIFDGGVFSGLSYSSFTIQNEPVIQNIKNDDRSIHVKILLGSGGIRTAERKALYIREVKQHFRDLQRVLFIPYALNDHENYLKMIYEKGLSADYELEGIHHFTDPVRAVLDADALYIGGGNSFRLLYHLYEKDLLEPIRQRVEGGMPYLGVSAGSNVACPTIQTTNDMPIIMPHRFESLGLVSFQINPHYFNGQTYNRQDNELKEHFGETRDQRIREYHEVNSIPVIGLKEGSFLRVIDGQITLVGNSARIFRKDSAAIDVGGLDETLEIQI